jgi:pimeloyl-ACP methyl ester carboxylesterase
MPLEKISTGIDLYYESQGRGEALVFIPGTGFSGNVWMETQVEPLSRSLQVIVHDPRGCGRSTHFKGVYTIDQMANDVAALLEHLNVRSAHIVGHSMGGRIGLSLALNFPAKVKSLILAAAGSGPAAREGAETIPGLPYRLAFDLIEMGFEKYLHHEICGTDTYFTPAYRKEQPDKVQAFYEMVWKYHARLPEYLQLCIARHNWEATHRLGDVTVPTLVVVGDNDVVGSNHVAQAQVLAKRIPKAEYKMLKGQSHGFFWQAPEETNAWILQWVGNHA